MSQGRRRIGLLGGTFDPPHIGHLLVAINVRAALVLDTVLLVVANEPWQKTTTRRISDPRDRLAMVEAVVRGIDGLEASSIEIDRGGESYTIDTVEQLRVQQPDADLYLIVGADAAAGLDTWIRVDELRRLVTLVIVDRPGAVLVADPIGWVVSRVDVPSIDTSSTDLRDRAIDGRPLDLLLPDAVVACMRDRRLYGSGDS